MGGTYLDSEADRLLGFAKKNSMADETREWHGVAMYLLVLLLYKVLAVWWRRVVPMPVKLPKLGFQRTQSHLSKCLHLPFGKPLLV